VTVTCPSCGHESVDTEWCDDCGRPLIGGDPALPLHATGPILPAPRCPACGERRLGQFCQACGYNFASGDGGPSPITGDTALAPDPVPAPLSQTAARHRLPTPDPSPALVDTGFEVHVSADRDFFDRLAVEGETDSIVWPPYAPDRTIALRGENIRIGRGRRDGTERPEIDLSAPPADVGVSHLHAVLMRTGDTWSIVDLGSYNGTRLGGRRLEANVPVPLPEGTVVHLGAWTALRLRRKGKDAQ
jgi:hypothetical protein